VPILVYHPQRLAVSHAVHAHWPDAIDIPERAFLPILVTNTAGGRENAPAIRHSHRAVQCGAN